ncbi:PDZ and LIM domain protein Zasp isoform X2 [Cydia amplana]|uniref:PDZ and LIM domain protein Zasp isoform X2 n=1 Tax=Cydia amplana TaxID=1869771 RepID=UPI002FE66A16
MAQLLTVRLNKAGPEPLGFRLQGGKDFGTPLVVQKVNGGSPAERAGLQAGDALIKVNNTDVFTLRHQEAQDAIRAAGVALELVVQRGGGTWRPAVTPTGSLPRPGSRPLGTSPTPVTNTSLKATPQPSLAFGSGHNNVAKPFGYMNGDNVKSIVNKQYNTPVKMYSDQTIAETLSAQTEVLAGGVLGVNFKKNEKTYDAEKSAVFKVLQEEQNDPEPEVAPGAPPAATGLRHVQAPVTRPDAPLNNTGGLPVGQNICEECERLITGVFVRIKDKNLHVECFKCSTCGTSLKNQGYYNLNGKLYCDIHAKLVARQNPPASNLEPVTVPPGGRIPTNTYSTPLPPLATSNYSNGSSSLFSPSSNISGPKPFGSSIGSAYSPSLSPRSAPLSPARPVQAPAPAYTPAPAPAYAPAYTPAPAAPAPAHAPFAPSKNVKSVVWPPPNPPEDEPPNVLSDYPKTLCQKPRAEPPTVKEAPMERKMSKVELPVSTMQDTSMQSISTSQQIAEFTSSSSYAAAQMSTATAATTRSETVSVVESKQTQQVISESSCTVQSFTEQAVSQSQMSTMYQSQTSPPVEKIFDNPMNQLDSTSMSRKESATEIKSEMVTEQRYEQCKRESLTESQIKTVDVPKTEIVTETRSQQSKRESVCESQPRTVDAPTNEQRSQECKRKSVTDSQIKSVDVPKTDVVTEQTAQESRRESVIENQITTVDVATTEIITAQMSQESKRESLTECKLNTVEIANNTQDPQVVKKQSEAMEQPIAPIKENTINADRKQSVENIPITNTNPENPANKNVLQSNPTSPIKPLPPTSIPNPVPKGFVCSMIDALTTAPDRPYSPLPEPAAPSNLLIQSNLLPENPNPPVSNETQNEIQQEVQDPLNVELPPQPPPMFTQQPKRGITPIPPIKTYNPPETRKKDEPIPLPPQTEPYIPPDFKIIIEPKVPPRDETASPFVEALTTAPDRPFTPGGSIVPNTERSSLKEALTIAPERSYSPLPLGSITNKSTQSSQSTHYTSTSTVQVQSTSLDIVRPIATQSITQMTHSETSNMQNTCKLQSSSEMSAFRPVPKQVFPPPQPEEFCQLANFPPMSQDIKTNFEKSVRKQEAMITESQMMQQSTNTFSNMTTQGFSSVKSAQNFFEQLDKRESLSSVSVRSKSGLHKPDNIPPYQKHFEQLPSQRGITPEVSFAPAVLQRPVTPTTDPPIKPKDKPVEPKLPPAPMPQPRFTPEIRTPAQPPPVHFHKDAPISMTFQPVTDEPFLRASPARSRPSTPSMINKPAPIIPYYQMNLVSVEHSALETHLYEPSSPETTSRSPTPRMRSKSPAPGPPPNPLKAHAPRIKESTPQRSAAHSLLNQATSNLRKEHEMSQKGFQSGVEVFNASGAKNWSQDQPSVIKEQRHSNVGFKSETYNKGNVSIKEDSAINQNYGQRQMQSQNVSEYGNMTVQTSRKTFEEYERTQSAKVIEIHKGGSSSFGAQQQIESNVQTSSNRNQVFPPPVMSLPSSQTSSVNHTNQNVVASRNTESCYPNPSISGANQGPVCDPTPSTGSSVGAAARGKTFGVSSAPKRGRGVLNKAALPGSRIPLCGSCNGNIRGPFITALGRIWCPEHFICVNATCRRPLQDIGFVEENGQLYCEFCFEQYIAPACDKCHAKIKGDCLNAIGKHFHPECFNCVYCGKLFGNNPFFLEDGLPYCESDWNELFTTKCFACGFPVEAGDRWVEALNNNYHSHCFNCTVCKKNLEGQSFFAKGGRPFCKTHAR